MGRARLVVAAHGGDARAALWEAVEGAKGGDLLAPVTVAVPSTYAGLGLRRELGRRRGLVNVRFVALARVAEALGAPDLAAAGRRPLTPPLRTEAIHATLVADPGPLAGVAEHPSTEAALAASFADLRRAPDGARRRLGARGGRVGAITRLYEQFRDRTRRLLRRGGPHARRDDGRRATPPSGSPTSATSSCTSPTRCHPARRSSCSRWPRRDAVTVVLGLTGDPEVDAAETGGLVTRLSPGLGAPERTGAGTPPAPPLGTGAVSAPDPEDEVRAVVRRVVEHAERGTPLHRIAILTRVDEPYGRLVPELLDGAGVAWNGSAPRRLADATAGRVLRGLLDLAEHDLARDAVAAWLASGPIVDPADGRPVDAARWDVLSREAGVVGGADQWAERLAHHVAAIEATLAGHLDADVTDWRRRGIEREVDADATAGRVRRRPRRAGAAARAGDLAGARRHGRPVSSTGTSAARPAGRRWPDDELEAGRQVVAALEGCAPSRRSGPRSTSPASGAPPSGALDAPATRHGRFGAGVFVGRIRHAYGGNFDVVYVLGAVEGSLPPRGREDPLLPDEVRRVEGLAHHGERRIEERHDYLAALAAARERILCFPRADPRAQRTRLPARWLLETARALHGSELTAEGLRALAEPPLARRGRVVRARASSPTPFPGPSRNTTSAACSTGVRPDAASTGIRSRPAPLAAGCAPRVHGDPVAGVARAMTAFDGLVGPHAVSRRRRRADLLADVARELGDLPVPLPARQRAAPARDPPPRGRPRRSARSRRDRSCTPCSRSSCARAPERTDPGQPWDDADLGLLLEIAEDHFRDAEARGVTGRRVRGCSPAGGCSRPSSASSWPTNASARALGVLPASTAWSSRSASTAGRR